MVRNFKTKAFNKPLSQKYRWFWLAYSFSMLGRFVHGMALTWLVWKLTGSPLWLAAIALLSALPALPLAPIAGQVADRFHRHQILLVTQTIGCCIALITAVLAGVGDLSPLNLSLLALCFGVVSSIDGPAMHAMLVESGETVSHAVTRQSLVMNVARSIAPMIAVFIIEHLGAALCFGFNSACFLPMIAIMAFLRIPNRTKIEERKKSINVGIRLLFARYRILRDVLPQIAVLAVLVMPAVSLLPAITLKEAALLSFGSMSSGLGFGAVVAAVLMQRNRRVINHVTTVWIGGWICCFGFATLPGLESLETQWICALVAGAAMTFSLAAANNAIQIHAPDCYRGRFSAMYLAVLLGFVPLGQLMVGLIAELFGASLAIRGCAIAGMVLMVGFAYFASAYSGDGQEGRPDDDDAQS